MTILQQLSESREELRDQLLNMVSKYFAKYFRQLYRLVLEPPKDTLDCKEEYNADIEFNKQLTSVVKWSKDKKRRGYQKFKDWMWDKYEQDSVDLSDLLNSIQTLTIKIIINEPYEYSFDYNLPYLSDFYFDSLKEISKYIYENYYIADSYRSAFESKNKDKIQQDIIDVLKKVLDSYLPIETIFDKINETQSDRGSELDAHSYTFENLKNIDIESKVPLNQEPIKPKPFRTNKLDYVSSDEISNYAKQEVGDLDTIAQQEEPAVNDIKQIQFKK